MNTFVIGNSGAGKSTVARHLAGLHDLVHVDLDAFAWLDAAGKRRPTPEAAAAVLAELSGRPAVIEGCYAELVGALLGPEDKLVWLDLPVEMCLEHCRARPFEAHKWPSAEAQDAFLPTLLAFVAAYPSRTDDLGATAHEALFLGHDGPRLRLTERGELAPGELA